MCACCFTILLFVLFAGLVAPFAVYVIDDFAVGLFLGNDCDLIDLLILIGWSCAC